MKCSNCHQKCDAINDTGLCQDCAEAFKPNDEFKAHKFASAKVTR